jgi:transposase
METKVGEVHFTNRKSKHHIFDKRLIQFIVDQVVQGVPRQDLISEYGMSYSTLGVWFKQYGPGPVRRAYSVSQKRSVVRAVTSGMSYEQAKITFNLSSASLVRKWVKSFKENNADLLISNTFDLEKNNAPIPQQSEEKALRKALEESNLKILALETMIDIAQEQLNINIRKKSGAKQSPK